ncbi:MAG: HPr family phosphocarrier protein [Thermoguttaceae bacterium]
MSVEAKRSRDLVVPNRHGIHARVATMLAKKAMEFRCHVSYSKGRQVADGRSVLDLLSLGAGFGDQIILEVHGDDAEGCMSAILGLFESQFDEGSD